MKAINCFFGTLFLLALLTGCKDEEIIDPRPEDLAPLANAGNDTTLVLGGKVILDGLASADPEEKPLTYEWLIKTKPDGSTASIENPQQPKGFFTPDVAGTYTFELTVSDGNAQDKDEKTATITATNPGNGSTAQLIDADINADRVLENIVTDPEQADYIVKAMINVNAKLSIKPGVVIVFEEDKGLKVGQNGKLIAIGTEAEPITFTGKEEEAGYWAGIMLLSSSTDNEISFAKINYAGSIAIYPFSHNTAVGVADQAYLRLSNTSIEYSQENGLFVASAGAVDMSNNYFANNQMINIVLPVSQAHKMDTETTIVAVNEQVNYVTLRGDRLELAEEVSWNRLSNGAYYHVIEEVSVLSGLRLQEGVQLRFNAYEFFRIMPGGYLHAKGTEANPIRFDIDVQTGANWGGILFKSPSNENLLEWVEVHHAGNGTPAYGMAKSAAISVDNESGAKLSMKNCQVVAGKAYGLYVEKGAYLGEFINNSFTANKGTAVALPFQEINKLNASAISTSENGLNAIELVENTLNIEAEVVLSAMADGTAYYVPQELDLRSGLKVKPGVAIEFGPDALMKVTGGYLSAVGTADARIRFTGTVKEKAYWKGMVFKSSSAQNMLEYTEVSHGGRSNMPGMVNTRANIAVDAETQGRLMVKNSRVSSGGGYGIAVETATGATINADAGTSNTFENLDAANVYAY